MLTRADELGDEFFIILDGTASVDVATEKRGPLEALAQPQSSRRHRSAFL